MKRRSFLISIAAGPFGAYAGNINGAFFVVKLAHGVSLAIPRTWEVLRGNEMIAIDNAAGAAIDLSGYSRLLGGSESLLVANFPDANLYASVSVTALEVGSVRPNFALQLTNKDLSTMQGQVRHGIEISQARMGTRVWAWSELRVERLGKYSVIRTGYLRTAQWGDTQVELYKFFGTGRVFDVALSTKATSERINRPILDRVAQSIEVGN